MTPQSTPEGPGYPGGQGPNPNSLFRALRHEDFDLQSTFLAKMSSFPDYLDVTRLQTDRPKSTRKYLLDKES